MVPKSRSLPVRASPPDDTAALSLRAAGYEGGCTAIMSGMSEPFMIPYALALGATSFQAGLLSSVRNLVLALVQLKAADAVGWAGSRKTVVLWTVGLQAALWVPIALVGPLFGTWAVAALIACYTVATASAALGGPAWGSLIAEYLPAGERGHFFARRARVVGFFSTVGGLVAGGLLELLAGRPVLGFGLLCAAAGVSRAFSWYWVARFHEEPWHESPHLRFSFWQFVRQVRRSNFARFSLCLAAFNFAVHLAAPYFAVYMLRELHFGYLAYTAVVLAGSVTGFLASPWWGRVGDRVGNRAVIRWTALGVAILPLLWCVSGARPWMAALNATGAFLWGGLNLSATNFLYDAVTPPKRHTCLAYFNVVNGVGVSFGALVGGAMIGSLPLVGTSAFAAIFVCSTALRFAVAAAFPRFVREVRELHAVGPVRLRDLMFDPMGQRLVHILDYLSRSDAPQRRIAGVSRVGRGVPPGRGRR